MRYWAETIVSLGLCASCASCGMSYSAPKLDLPPRWSLPQTAAEAQRPSTLRPQHSLWERFKSSELSGLLELAANGSLDNISASARVAQSEALVRVARAPLYPSLGMEVDVTGQSDNGKYLGSIRGGFADFGLVAAYDVDLWGQRRGQARAAEARSHAGRYDRDSTALEVAAGVANTYFEILSLRERLTRARSNLEASERVLQIVSARERAGAALSREVAQQQSLVASEAARVEALGLDESDARLQLSVALGRSPDAVSVQADSLAGVADAGFDVDELSLPAQLLSRRPDIARAEAELAASHADVSAARAALLPTLKLNGFAAFQRVFLSQDFNGSGLVYSGTLTVSQPLFEGGALRGERDAAAARKAGAEAEYRKTVLVAVSEVERALRACAALQRQQAQQKTAVEEARRAFSLLEREYEAGGEELLSVLDAQRTLFRLEDEVGQLQLGKLRSAVSLVRALGGGWFQEK